MDLTKLIIDELKMKKNDLAQKLKELGLNNRDFSILETVKPDCFNLVSSGKYFIVFYVDDRGNKLYESTFCSFDAAAKYIILLIKSML